MKKIYLPLIMVLMIIALVNINAEPRRVLLEYCTGTWCGWCPCGHQAITNDILPAYPNTIFIAYHGASTDPWQNFDGNAIRSLMGFSAYPTASVDRTNTPSNPYFTYTMWLGGVTSRYTSSPTAGVDLQMTAKSYNAGSRTLNVTVNSTAAQQLSGQYKISFVLIENNLIYQQNHYSSCGYNGYINDYVHKHVARSMMNGPTGENLNTGGVWNQGQSISKSVSKVLDAGWNETKCEVIVFVYKDSSTIALGGVQQAYYEAVTTPLGIMQNNEIPKDFTLGQNYPNPFNPETHIKFSIPVNVMDASLKVYDITGKLIMTFFEGPIAAGEYTAQFNGNDLPSGVYLYKLTAGKLSETRKMILVK